MIIVEKLAHKRKLPSKNVRIVLLGLTPGAQQHKAINNAKNLRDGAFKGYMRTQMYEWFNDLGISANLKLLTENSLYEEDRFLSTTYMTSLLREPVYIVKNDKKQNYTGRSPFPWKNEQLTKMMEDTFETLHMLKETSLIIPLGQVVSKALMDYSDLDEFHYILHGFPHPSGANAKRNIEFEKNKKNLKSICKKFFKTEKPIFE